MTDDGIPRPVKPRNTDASPEWLPILSVDTQDRCFLSERTGEIGPVAELHKLIESEPASIVIAPNAAELVAELDGWFGPSPRWQYRLVPHRREVNRPGAEHLSRPPVIVSTVVAFFGWRTGNKKKGRWFYPIDPCVFGDYNLYDLLGPYEAPSRVEGLLRWGQDLRAFCQTQQMRVTPTAGGLAGQLLRDPRFYPEARRKVPRKTNDLARAVLPGNHYDLLADEREVIPSATYLDLRSAHHNAAASIRFPHADHLFRRGDWFTTDPTDTTGASGDAQWTPGTDAFREIVRNAMGLLRVRLSVPELNPTHFPPPYMRRPGERSAYIFTNEIPYILSLGASIDGIDAAWVSFKQDEGLNRYAVWALTETARMVPARKQWAKPALLSTYGVLAARPRPLELAYRRATGGDDRVYPAGSLVLPAKAKDLPARETSVANVIHRGMIEAETRTRVLEMARDLTALGHRVLSLYADAIIIEQGGPLSLLPTPWEIKAELTHLQFFNATSFRSRELVRLPGIPKEGRDAISRVQAMRTQARARIRRPDGVNS